VDNSQPPTDHLSQQVLINNTNTHILNTRSTNKEVNKNVDKVIGFEGQYNIILRDGKKYLKHKFKDEPIKPY
jgi:hypothetical protein